VWTISWKTGRCLIIAYVIVLVLLMLFERRLVYPAELWDSQVQFGEGSSLQEVYFPAADGVKLHALYSQRSRPRVVILYLHGNGGNIGHRAGLLRFLSSQYDASVLGVSYRGYGKSDGQPTENGLSLDAEAALKYLLEKERVDVHRVLIVSRSMGAAVGIKLAIDRSVPAICIESTFTSLPDVAARQYPWFPVRLLMKNQFPSLNRISQYRGRLLQSHGSQDELVPLAMGQELYAAATCSKEFRIIPNGTHNSPQSGQYYSLVDALITQVYD
jgi:pimeloyl-ACP methyl ester carboxylesterase